MAERFASGTFTATGESALVKPHKTDITDLCVVSVTHGGTATVNLEARVDGANWRVVKSYTASATEGYRIVGGETLRLNCTAHNDDVDYFLGHPLG